MNGLPFNKLCELEDFSDPELTEVLRDVCGHKLRHFSADFPKGAEHRKDWEVSMAVRALDHFGALRPDATLLGVAVGLEDTLFYLTRRARHVFATDRYYSPDVWGNVAPGLMLVEPQDVAPFQFDVERLVVQHMDGRWLRYPADTFDGIFSSGSIEHFGELQDAAYSAYEMGRVLKPGGILSLSTEFKLSGPKDGIGWPGRTLLFSRENLARYIVEASGLELVDEFVGTVSPSTLAVPRNLAGVIAEAQQRGASPDAGPEFTLWDFPHLVMIHDGYAFGSVHLALRKTDRYPVAPNAWARPPAATLAGISAYNRSVAAPPPEAPAEEPAEVKTSAQDAPPERVAEPAVSGSLPTGRFRGGASPESYLLFLDQGLEEIDGLLSVVDGARGEADRHLADLGQVRTRVDAAVGHLNLPPGGDEGVRTTAHKVTLPGVASFVAVLETVPQDDVSQGLAASRIVDAHCLELMVRMLDPTDLVLDLGAHVGTFSLAAAALGCGVVAVEASPVNAALLRSSVWHNGFHNLRVVHAAVSDLPGTLQFHADGPRGHVAWGEVEETLSVTAVTVDELLSELGWPTANFVKMDVEGCETRALAGMQRLLGGPDAPPVLFESNGHTLAKVGSGPGELVAAFEALGYGVYIVDPGRLTRISSADRQPETVVDCLALKRRPRGLDDWVFVVAMRMEDCVERVVFESRHPNPDCRIWISRELESFPEPVLEHPDVAEALERLRSDPLPDVQAAAAWSRVAGRKGRSPRGRSGGEQP